MGACALQTNIGGRGAGKIMLVSMNPGTQESLAGKCFVGPSGKELDALLAAAGIPEADVRRTNAVRCEGQPDPAAIEACRHHLRDEILAHKPEVIVALGDVALQSLCKKSGVMTKRGKSFPLHASFGYECEVYVTFHPAYVLRSPHTRDTVIADLRRVRDRNRTPTEVKWNYWKGVLPRGLVLGYDIETIDEQHNIVDYPTLLSVAGTNGVVVAMGADDIRACYAALLERERNGTIIVGHNNMKFDKPILDRFMK
jgi:DNA polymerase